MRRLALAFIALTSVRREAEGPSKSGITMIGFPGGDHFGTTIVKLLLVFLMSLFACCPSVAAQNERFVEFPYGWDQTLTYDLRTVQMIQPGRFTIVRTTMDNADLMRFELKALDILRTYCKSPDGKYQPPTDVFTLGPPDLPIESIEVKSAGLKIARWRYPYKRLAIEERGGEYTQQYTSLVCKGFGRAEWKLYQEARAGLGGASPPLPRHILGKQPEQETPVLQGILYRAEPLDSLLINSN
jgi:hypothetical protein